MLRFFALGCALPLAAGYSMSRNCNTDTSCCEPNPLASAEMVLGVIFFILLVPVGMMCFGLCFFRPAPTAAALEKMRPLIGSAARHGRWRNFTVSDKSTAATEFSTRGSVRFEAAEDGGLVARDCHLAGMTSTVRLSLEPVKGAIQGTLDFGAGCESLRREGTVHLVPFTHWWMQRRPGLHGKYVIVTTRRLNNGKPKKKKEHGRVEFSLQDAALEDASSTCTGEVGGPVTPTLRSGGLLALGLALLGLALLLPTLRGVGGMMSTLSMPPAGGYWGPGVMLFTGLFAARDAAASPCALLVALPVTAAMVTTSLVGLTTIEEADYCGLPGRDAEGNRTLLERFCNDDGSTAYGCVVTTEWLGKCSTPKWTANCAVTTDADYDAAAFEDTLPSTLRWMCALTAVGACLVGSAKFAQLGFADEERDGPYPFVHIVSAMEATRGARHGEILSEFLSSGAPTGGGGSGGGGSAGGGSAQKGMELTAV